MKTQVRFLVKFFGTILVLYLVLALKPVDRHVVVPFTTAITVVAAQILNLIGYSVTTAGTLMRDGTFVVDVKNGCNGLEAMLLLCSAILATPAPWKARHGVAGSHLPADHRSVCDVELEVLWFASSRGTSVKRCSVSRSEHCCGFFFRRRTTRCSRIRQGSGPPSPHPARRVRSYGTGTSLWFMPRVNQARLST